MEVESLKPDFSGKYVLDRPVCSLEGGAAETRSATLSIDHRDPQIQINAHFEFANDKTVDYSIERLTNGSEVADETGGTATLLWEDDVLVFTYSTSPPAAPFMMAWRYELQDGGRRLTATERIRGSGRDQDNVWVFERG